MPKGKVGQPRKAQRGQERPSGKVRLQDIMSRNVVATRPDATLRAVARLMRRHSIGCVVVVDQRRLIGILTERDIIRAVASGKAPDEVLAEDMMSQPVVCATGDMDVTAAARLLVSHNIKKLPLMDGGGQVEGIVTFTDFAAVLPAFQKAFAEALQEASQDAKARFGKHVTHAPWTFI